MQQRNYLHSTIFRQREYPHFMRDRILQKKIFKSHQLITNGAKLSINSTLDSLFPPLLKSTIRNIINRQQRPQKLISRFRIIIQQIGLIQQFPTEKKSPMTLRIALIIIIKAGQESHKIICKQRIPIFKMHCKSVNI